jgi:Spy/CpxP family protein refolding chaperone
MNYADALTMQDSINARRERMEKMKAEGKKIERSRPTDEEMKAQMEIYKEREKIRDEQMKSLLTPEQYKKYTAYKEERQKKMQQGRGGRRGGGHRGGRRGGK